LGAGVTYRPLPDYLTIKDSAIDGLGLHATKDIKDGEVLGISHYRTKEFGLIRSPLGGFINHDKNPNCIKIDVDGKDDGYSIIQTIKEIKAGEEILLCYKMYNPAEEV
jgi:SET domain-containing protein